MEKKKSKEVEKRRSHWRKCLKDTLQLNITNNLGMTWMSKLRGLIGKCVTDLSSLASELDSKVWKTSHFKFDHVFLSMN